MEKALQKPQETACKLATSAPCNVDTTLASFKPDTIADPLKPENIYKDSGRGIFIVKTLMDKVDYNFYDDGSEVILYKSIPKSK